MRGRLLVGEGMGTGWSEDVRREPESVKQGPIPYARPDREPAKFRPLAYELAPPAADALTGGAALDLHQDECERSRGWRLESGG